MTRRTAAQRKADEAAAAAAAEAEATAEAATETESEPSGTADDSAPAEPATEAAEGGEATEDAAPAEPEAVEVKPEVPFGQDPDDLADGDEPNGGPAASPSGGGAAATFTGVHGQTGLQPVAITVTVPLDGAGYDGVITVGRTYTLPLGKPTPVEDEDLEWLTGHPVYDIEGQSG